MEIRVPVSVAAVSQTGHGDVKEIVMSIQQMLVPLAFSAYSQHTLDDAIQLAKRHQVHVTLLHVIRVPTLGGALPVGAGAVLPPLLSEQEIALHHALERCAECVWDAGLACEAILTHGTPFQRIMEMVENRRIDLIVMGAHRHRGLQRLFRGGLAKKVMRLAPCLVWIAPCSASAAASPDDDEASLDEWRRGDAW